MDRSSWKILLIEDSENFAKLVRSMLTLSGLGPVDFLWADRLVRGLSLLAEGSPDLVLCDLGLPDSSGIDTLRAVAKAAPEVPIVVLTGEDEGELGEAAMREGAEDFLSKSRFDRRSLERAIRYAAERNRLERELREREEKLTRSAERFRIASELASDYIYEWDMAAASLNWSNNVDRLFGYEAGEFPRSVEGVLDQVHPEDRPHLLESIQSHLKDDEPFSLEYRVRRKDGEYLWISSRAKAIKDEHGRMIRWIGVNTDITAARRSEQTLRESEESYRNLFELESDAIFLIDGASGRILEANSAAVNLYGYDRDELLAMHNFDLSAEPEQTRKVVAQETRYVPIRHHRKKNGEVFPAEITGSYFDLKGRRSHIAAVRDITERIEGEQSLRRSREFLFSVLNSMSAHIAVLDGAGRIVEVNEAWRRFGRLNGLVCPEDCVGVNYLKVCDEAVGESSEGSAEAAAGIREVLERKREFFLQEYPCHGPGQKRWFDLRVTALDLSGETLAIAAHENTTDRRLALEALEHSRESLSTILDTVLAGIAIFDADGRVTYANRAMEGILGIPPEKLIGRNVLKLEWDLIHLKPLDEEQRTDLFARALDQGEPIMGTEIVTRDASGRKLHLYVSNTVLRDEGGRSVSVLSSMIDISSLKQLEMQLRETEERYGALFDRSSELIYISDLAGNFLDVNPTALNRLGYTREEIMGSNYATILVPEDLPKAFKLLMEMLETGENREMDEYRVLTKDGRMIIAETNSAFLYRDGKPYGIQGVARDVTERRKLEAQLRETEERYRALFERSMDLLYVADLDGKFIDANPAALRLLGYDKDEITSLNFAHLLDPDQLARALRSMQEIMRTGTQREMDEFRLRAKDGREIIVETIGVLLYREGEAFAIQGIARDVTERKRLERELELHREQLEREVEERTTDLHKAQEELVRKERLAALGQLAGSIGHEILNPLGVIRNSVYYLNQVLKEPGDKARRHLEILDREIDRSRRIVQDLLNLTRTGPRSRVEIDLSRLVEESLEEARLPAWIEVERDYEPELPRLAVDPDQLKQVFLNILRNAFQSMEQAAVGTKLRIRLARDGEGAAVSFQDSGAGVPPQMLDRIFEPLVSTKTHGFGLGLTVSLQLARLNGGDIEAENVPEGGARFTVRLRPNDSQ